MNDDFNQPVDSTAEKMIDEGGAIQQPTTLPRQAVPIAERMEATLHQLKGSTRDYVNNHPWQNVAIAFGVGFAIGALLAHETNSQHSSRWF